MAEVIAEIQPQIKTAEQTSRNNFAEIKVKEDIVFKTDRGLQGILLCMEENNFAPDQVKIQNKLQTNLHDRWNFKLFDRIHMEEAKDSSLKFPEWKVQMVNWVKGLQNKFPAEYKTINQVLAGITGQNPENFTLNEQTINQIADIVFINKGGIESFVNAASSLDGLSDLNKMQVIKDLAGSFFGDEICSTIVSQMVDLESVIKESKDINKLTAETIEKSGELSANGIFLISEIKRLLGQSRVENSGEVKTQKSGKIAEGKILGGRPEQQDNTKIIEEALPQGVEYIAMLGDGHGVGGNEASKLGLMHFEKKFIIQLNQNPSISIEEAIKEAAKFADKEIINAYPEGGTTFVASIKAKGKTYVVNIGDSRLLMYSPDGQIKQLTTEHNWQAKGEEKYKFNIQLYRSLGDRIHKEASNGEISSEPEIITLEKVVPGTRFILCSDGMKLSNEELSSALTDKSVEQSVEEIIKNMNNKNPSDNVSAIVIQA